MIGNKIKKIDIHRHLSRNEDDFNELSTTLANDNIEKVVIFGHNGLSDSDFDNAVLAKYNDNPDKIIPFACKFMYTKEDIYYAEQCLERGFRGFGEILLGHSRAVEKSFAEMAFDSHVPVEIFKLAGRHKAPVIVHCDSKHDRSLENALLQCPDTDFIWSHIAYDFSQGQNGDIRNAHEILYFLDKYEKLCFDISMWIKNPLCFKREEYLDIFEKYNERFLFGLDLTKDYGTKQSEYIGNYVELLADISLTAQENIYYNNAKRLLRMD